MVFFLSNNVICNISILNLSSIVNLTFSAFPIMHSIVLHFTKWIFSPIRTCTQLYSKLSFFIKRYSKIILTNATRIKDHAGNQVDCPWTLMEAEKYGQLILTLILTINDICLNPYRPIIMV